MAARKRKGFGPITRKRKTRTPKGNPTKGGKIFGNKRRVRKVRSS
jgi:hypothetical protein